MGHQPYRSTTTERTGKALAAGFVRAGACCVASVGCSVRERLAQRSGAEIPIPVDRPAGSPVLGAEAEIRNVCRRFPGLTMRRRESPRRSPSAFARRFKPSNCRRPTDVHAAGRLGRRRQSGVRGCRTRMPTFDRQASLLPPTLARRAMSPHRTELRRGERYSDVRQPVKDPARTRR